MSINRYDIRSASDALAYYAMCAIASYELAVCT